MRTTKIVAMLLAVALLLTYTPARPVFAQAAKTHVVDYARDAAGNPLSGKVTFILTQKSASSPDGLVVASPTVTAALDSTGKFEVYLYPSASLSPVSYYQVYVTSGAGNQTLLGIYNIPSSSSVVTLAPYKVTNANLAAQYTFADLPSVLALSGTISQAALQSVFAASTDGKLQKYDAANTRSADSAISENSTQLTSTKKIVAPAFEGNGEGLTNIGTGTGGVINTGSTTVGADSDVNGVGKVSIQTRGIERIGVENDGSVNIPGQLNAAQFTSAILDNGGAAYNVKNSTFGAKGDGKTLGGCSMTSGSAALTCSSGFTAADASKLLVVPGAGAAGADLSTTISSYTSATQVTLAASASTTVASKTVSYATNDTAAIQSAITTAGTAGGGVVFLPPGFYGVTSGVLTVGANHVRLAGAGWASRVACFSTTGDTLTFDNGLSGSADSSYLYGAGVEDVRFNPAVTRTSGWEIKAVHFNVAYFQRLAFLGVYGAMLLGRSTDYAVIAHVNDIRAKQYYYGIKVISVLDGWFTGLSFDTYNITVGATGLWLSGSTEGCGLMNIDIVNSHPSAPTSTNTFYALRVYNDAGTSTGVRFNKFSNCQFDSHNPGARIDDGHDNRFTSCWFASWRDSGLVVTGTTGNTTFVNCDAVNSYVDGFYVDATGGGIIFDSCTALANGRSGAGYGFDISGTASHVTLTNCKAVNDATNFPGNAQQYGFNFASGVTHFFLSVADATANSVGGVQIGASCNYFKIDMVDATGYAGTGLTNNAGTSATKVIGTVFQ